MIASVLLFVLLAGYSIEDICKKRIHARYLWIFAILGVLLYVYDGRADSAWSLFGGVLIGAGVMLLSLLTKESIGMGDGMVLVVTGIYLGVEKNLLLIMLALFYAALCSLALMARGRKKKHEIPFIPFLLVGYLTILIGGRL